MIRTDVPVVTRLTGRETEKQVREYIERRLSDIIEESGRDRVSALRLLAAVRGLLVKRVEVGATGVSQEALVDRLARAMQQAPPGLRLKRRDN